MTCKTTTAMYLNVSTQICGSGSSSRVDSSTIKVTGTLSATQTNSWNTNAIYGKVNGKTSMKKVKNGGKGTGTLSFSFNDNVGSGSGSKTYTAVFQVYNNAESGGVGSTASVDFSVSYASGGSAPTAPTISASTASASQINVTWGTTSLGDPAGTVYLYNGTSSSPSTQISSKTSTGNSTYNNTGLTANTKYYYKATASNSIGSNSSSVVNATTGPGAINSVSVSSVTANSAAIAVTCASSGSALTTTLQTSTDNTNWSSTGYTNVQGTTKTVSLTGLAANTSYTRYYRINTTAGNSGVKSATAVTLPAGITSATAGSIGETSANIAVVCASSGSAKTTHLQISSDNSTWTDVATGVQGTTVNVPVTGLTPSTSVTRYFRVHTDAGNSAVTTVTFTTLKIAHFYGSVNGETKRIKKLYGSVNNQTKEIKKLYGSVNGETKLIYRA